jgi:hypothetical protein
MKSPECVCFAFCDKYVFGIEAIVVVIYVKKIGILH